MCVKWASSADADLTDLLAYFVAIGEIEAGQSIVDRLFTATERLVDFPLSGKIGRVPQTRELVLADLPYILVYRVKEGAIQVVNVIHTSRQYPR